MYDDDDEWSPEEIARLRAHMRCVHDWPEHGRPGFEPCVKCGYVGVREVTRADMGEEAWHKLLAQLANWELEPEEIIAGPAPQPGTSALDHILSATSDDGQEIEEENKQYGDGGR